MSQYHKITNESEREPLRIKVCGMNLNTSAVAGLNPDYLGFIFWEQSKRYFDGNGVELPHRIKKVGVFVRAYIEEIIEKVNAHQLVAVQLHGNETPEFCRILKSELKGVSIIKVFTIKEVFDFKELQPFESVCDYYLFDTKGKLPGGNGYKFNWKVLKDYPSKKPFFLSGGIGLEDLESAKEFMTRPESRYCHAVDVNSRFEIAPGLKDIAKLKEFINSLR